MRPVLFFLFGLPIGSYGFFMMTAHLCGAGALLWLARVHHRPVGPILDMVFAVVLAGLLGARLGYAYNQWDEFREHPITLLWLQKGGLSFFGGFALAFLAFLAVLRWRRIPVLATADEVCPVLPFTIGLVRIGCFLQGCCYGAPTDVPWAVSFTRLDGKVPLPLLDHPLHPSQLYESAFLFLLASCLALGQRRNRLPPGFLATFSILAYALFRLFADQYRGDLPRGFWGLPWLAPTQAAAFLGVLSAPIVLAICRHQAAKQP